MGQTAKTPRGNRTITVDFHDESTYFRLINDGKAFVECVLAFLLSLGFQLTHKSTCHGGDSLTRRSPLCANPPGRPYQLAHAVHEML